MNNYHTLTVGGEEHKLRLTISTTMAIEKRLGKSLYSALESINDNMIETMTVILWGALQQFNTNITFEKAADIFDRYIDEGHSVEDMMDVLNEMFTVSGFFNKGQTG